MAPVVQLRGLHKAFGGTRAVAGLDLVLQPGEVLGLVGPDGAGKTSTLRLCAGLLTPDAGTVEVCGLPLPARARAAHALLGYMPQQYSLYGDLSVIENLRFFAGMQGVPRKVRLEREARLLHMARLEPFRDRPAQALSGGMYKKLALACALIHGPALLLLDEPTNGVDPISRRELWAFLRERADEGVAVLVSTPYMDEAERCDRVVLLLAGRVAAEGTPAGLRAGLHEDLLELETGDALAARSLLAGLAPVARAYSVGRRVRIAGPRGQGLQQQVAAALQAAGLPVARLGPVEPSFEDIYLALTAGGEAGHGG